MCCSNAKLKKITEVDEEGKKAEKAEKPPVQGIPEFWPTVLKSSRLFDALIEPSDEDALKYLTDIKMEYLDSELVRFWLEVTDLLTLPAACVQV